MNSNAFLAWLRQGSTQTGLTALSVAAMGYMGGQMPLAGLIAAVAVGIVGLIWPENNDLKTHVGALVNDALAVAAAANPALGAALGPAPTQPAPSVTLKSFAAPIILAAFAAASLAACSAPQQQTTIATLEASLTAADHGVLAYFALPECGPGVTAICHTADVKAKAKIAEEAAYDAVKAAQASAAAGKQVDLTAASAAVAALTTLATTLPAAAAH